MNDPLDQLTPELLQRAERLMRNTNDWEFFCTRNRQLVLACMKAAMRVKKELTNMREAESCA